MIGGGLAKDVIADSKTIITENFKGALFLGFVCFSTGLAFGTLFGGCMGSPSPAPRRRQNQQRPPPPPAQAPPAVQAESAAAAAPAGVKKSHQE